MVLFVLFGCLIVVCWCYGCCFAFSGFRVGGLGWHSGGFAVGGVFLGGVELPWCGVFAVWVRWLFNSVAY